MGFASRVVRSGTPEGLVELWLGKRSARSEKETKVHISKKRFDRAVVGVFEGRRRRS
jgi:hypothetical protein